MALTLTAEMRKGLGRVRTGTMNLNFIGFFGGCTSKTKVTQLLKALINDYFNCQTTAEATINEYFDKAIEIVEPKAKDKSSPYNAVQILKTLKENRKVFQNMTGLKKEEDKTIQYMNNYLPPYEKYCFRFRHDDYLVLLDAMRIVFMYETKNEGLNVKEYPGSFDELYNALLDSELLFKSDFKRLKKLGKNGFLEYQDKTWCLNSFMKFFKPDEDVEFGLWINKKGGKFLVLNQSDRCALICAKDTEDDEFIFKLEEFADAL